MELKFILDNFKNLKFIIYNGVGVDHILEHKEELKKRNILVSNMRDSSSIPLAEFAILGILYFSK